jgi:hypothetical protein
MVIISSREFRDHQKKYFDLVDQNEQIIVQRGKDKAYVIVPLNDADRCGERGIRTPGTLIGYASLANWWIKPLSHLSGVCLKQSKSIKNSPISTTKKTSAEADVC